MLRFFVPVKFYNLFEAIIGRIMNAIFLPDSSHVNFSLLDSQLVEAIQDRASESS